MARNRIGWSPRSEWLQKAEDVTFPGASDLGGAAVLATLREFADAPGRYAVRLREPALLFQSARDVLLIAAQRYEGIPAGVLADAAQVACLFIKAAFLREGADHYTLLGLDAKADDAAIKQHYRLMMRLIHPDFAAASSVAWPSDAATRANLAYNVLSSPVQRREYDGALAEASMGRSKNNPAVEPPSRANVGTVRDPKAAERRTASARRRLRSAVALCGIAGALSLIAVALMFDRGSQTELVQRKSQVTPTARRGAPIETVGASDSALMVMPELTTRSREAALLAGNVKIGLTTVPSTVLAKPATATAVSRAKTATAANAEVAADESPNLTRSIDKNEVAPAEDSEGKESKSKTMPAVQRVTSALDSAPDAPVVLRASNRPEVGHVSADAVKEEVTSPTITISEVQPIIAALLQQLESGRGNNLILVLDKDARRDPSSLAFASYYDSFVNGARSVRVSQVNLKPEPAHGRLMVTGFVRVEFGEGVQQVKRLALRVEFSSKGGAVAMTRLTGMESGDR